MDRVPDTQLKVNNIYTEHVPLGEEREKGPSCFRPAINLTLCITM
jgi:hypothetical protein